MLDEGEGGKVDDVGARILYKKVCDVEHTKGCYNLALMLENGEGGSRDKAGARSLFQKACQLGDEDACS